MSLPRPYIGITGFTDPSQVGTVLENCPELSNRDIMIGVLASGKTMDGLPSRWPRRYPPVKKIGEIFPQHPHTVNLVHYSSKGLDLPLGDQLQRVMEMAGPNCHGLQLNMAWPPADELKRFVGSFPRVRIVLQCGQRALEQATDGLVAKLKPYDGLVQDILLDTSGGQGNSFDAEQYRRLLEEVAAAYPALGLGIAGGFGPDLEDGHRLQEFLVDFPTLSVDAEGRLRDMHDSLDTDLADLYLAQMALAASLFGRESR